MSREFIPDAAEGSAPGLGIKRQTCSRAASEAGESAHSAAVTSLSTMRLEEVPIAQKIGEKKFSYLDRMGNVITKEQATQLAGGVIYYQDSTISSKGRLRKQGSFISVDDARTVVSGSRASNRSDVADLQDLEGFHELSAVPEEPAADETISKTLLFRPSGPIMVAIFVIAVSSSVPDCSYGTDMKLLEFFGAETSDSLQRYEAHSWHHGAPRGDGRDIDLSDALAKLLRQAEKGGEDSADDMHLFLDDMSKSENDGDSHAKRKLLAEAEVARVLSVRKSSEILGEGDSSEQRQIFKHILRLLHPDKGLVSKTDARANLALRLAIAAHKSLGPRSMMR